MNIKGVGLNAVKDREDKERARSAPKVWDRL